MAKFNVPRLKRCRALGINPTYIGLNKTSNRQVKRTGRRLSEYGLQLREKQRAKFIYDVNEKQFAKYFDMASRSKGVTGEVLLTILESRLDNVLFRAGFAKTRPQGRVLISRGNIEVNGHKVDIASYLVKEGDVITIKESKRNNPVLVENIKGDRGIIVPEWLKVDLNKMEITVTRLPEREEIDLPIEEHLIVEFYSR